MGLVKFRGEAMGLDWEKGWMDGDDLWPMPHFAICATNEVEFRMI
jgi:hypothetical protein